MGNTALDTLNNWLLTTHVPAFPPLFLSWRCALHLASPCPLISLCTNTFHSLRTGQTPSLLWNWLWTSSPNTFSPFLISHSILSIPLSWYFKVSSIYNSHLCIFLIMYSKDLKFFKGMILMILYSIYHIFQCFIQCKYLVNAC